MTVVTAPAAKSHAPAPSLFARVLSAAPVLGIALGVLMFYFVEAWQRKTPWVFTDELEWTQISRAIEATGNAARRGQPIYFKSLYAFVIAPFWAIHSTTTAYAAIKYANAVLMPLAAVPTYFLGRMLLPRRVAAVVALLAVAIPGMAYVTSLVPEVFAYPWYALCSWLIVRALTRRRRRDYALAIGVTIIAGLIRWPQFATVPASFAIAAGILWLRGPRGRAMRSGWSRSDYAGAIALFAGGLILFNRVILQHEQIWQISTQYWKGRMLDLGLKAGLAFTVGMGILPVLGGFASLRLRDRRDDPAYRAFTAYLAAAIFCISLYTAVKAAYLSTVFSTLTEERNMIYLGPLMLLGTALVFTSRRIDWRIVAVSAAFVCFIVLAKPPELDFPYFEAPGYAILDIANRSLRWNVADIRLALLVVLVLSLAILVLRRRRWVAPAVVIIGAAWMLTSQIKTAAGIADFGNEFRAHLPAHLNWIDQHDQGQPVTYLGQEIIDPNGLWLTEFWNRTLAHVASLDGSAPGPGPTLGPNVVAPNGLLDDLGNPPYIVTDNGVTLQAPVVDHWKQLTLYRRHGPWRLLDEEQQVYNDSWVPGWSTYTYFRAAQHGTLLVKIGRQGYNGNAPPGDAVLSVGTVQIVNDQPKLGHVYARIHKLIRNGSQQVVAIPVAHTPVRIVITIKHTIPPSVDPRNLGAQVGFRFVPAKA